METEIKKGLDGVVVDTSSISKVMPEINALVYWGYPVQDLAENCSFEEVAYLLLHGELPKKSELEEFSDFERGRREISQPLVEILGKFPKHSHPMDTVRTGVSFLGLEETDPFAIDRPENMRRAMNLLAKIPTIIATDYRFRKGKERIAPRRDLSIGENFFNMCFGSVPPKEVTRAFEVSLVLYAEHGFNASTFTARVVTSTRSDLYGAVTAAIASLKGPLHGGANEQVMHMLKEVNDPAKAKDWMIKALEEKRTIMGFGHRVYKKGDSRVPTMKKYLQGLARVKNDQKWVAISDELEKVMVEKKDIHPNLDFPAGPAYYLMGFDIDMFTPIFVMSRITGWAAHIMEQTADNRLIRPLSKYTGPGERKIKPFQAR